MFAILYKGEEKLIDVDEKSVRLVEGMLLGYTEFPNDPVWEGKGLCFVPVEEYSIKPF